MKALAEAAAALLGGTLCTAKALHGGCLSQILLIILNDGREAIVKGGGASPVEAAMLRAIAASGAPAPKVFAAEGGILVMEAISADGGLSNAWASLGKALAKLHAAEGNACGWADDYAFGAVAIENGWMKSWPVFWAERRLLPNCSHVASALGRRIEVLAADLPNRLPELTTPSLLHGDLWGGNILAAGKEVTALIDPACYYGHGEVDIAMLNLFDGPSPAFYNAYGALKPGWKERLIIYQLWPALVHVRLFGSGYRPMVERLLSHAGV
ncbi:MAG: fructosamine kinase family protein [Rhodomicrobium sp.]